MNLAQQEYLEKFCQNREIDQETALQFAVVKGIMKQLENSKSPEVKISTESNLSCNCS